MANTTDQSSNPLAVYGYDQKTGQALAQSLGITTQQLAAAFAATPMTGGSAPQTTSYGMTTGGQPAGRDLGNTVNQLRMMQASGMGGGNQQQGPPSSTPGQVSTDPMNAAVNLGAAALNMPAIYNPTPGQIPAGSKGGVAQVASPVSSGTVPTVPQGPWSSVPGQTGSQGATGLFMQSNAPQSGVYNPFATPATTAGGTPTPTTPANAPGAGQPATPFATAPPAPGASASAPAQANWAPLMGGPPAAPTQAGGQWGEIAAHTAGLENAGKAMYAHMTGNDPNTATHDDIANFHTQLTNHIGGILGNAGTPGANYTAGVNQPPNTMAPAKMAAGGMVPGRGNQDTVPALLTPGEYVIPKQQAAQLFGGRTPIRMAEGGYVPPEVRKQRLTPPGSPPPAPSAQTPGQSTQQGSSTPAAADGGGQQGYWSNMVRQAQAQQALNSGGASGGGYNIPASQGGGYIGASPGPGMSGYIYPNQGAATAAGDVGTGQGPTGANTAAGVADVASGLFSGLQKAAAEYQKSIKPWQNVAQAFGQQGIPNYQDVNFQQDTVV